MTLILPQRGRLRQPAAGGAAYSSSIAQQGQMTWTSGNTSTFSFTGSTTGQTIIWCVQENVPVALAGVSGSSPASFGSVYGSFGASNIGAGIVFYDGTIGPQTITATWASTISKAPYIYVLDVQGLSGATVDDHEGNTNSGVSTAFSTFSASASALATIVFSAHRQTFVNLTSIAGGLTVQDVAASGGDFYVGYGDLDGQPSATPNATWNTSNVVGGSVISFV